MKKLVKILVTVVGVIALGLGAVFYFTSDMVSIADDFFSSARDGDIATAYSLLSEDFQATTTQAELSAFLENNRLVNYQDANWHDRSINGGRGELTGSVTTSSGGVVPISISFVKGADSWKIYSIQKPASGLQTESAPIQMPAEPEQVELVRSAIRVFAESINQGSMQGFYDHSSNLWQRQTTVEELDQAFVEFYNLGADLTFLDEYSPVFDPLPLLNDDGVLVLSGYYQTTPNQFYFEQKYVYEGLGWKLIGFSSDIR